MARSRIVARAVLTAGVAAAASLAMALPAQAHGARQVTCNGTIGETTVGDVVVADGTACVLDGTTVKGAVTVGAGAALDVSNAKVYKGVTSTSSGRVTAADSLVLGGLRATNTGVVRLANSGVLGNVTVSGEITTFSASGLAVGGALSATTVGRFDVSGSYVVGNLSANESFNGSNLCGNWVYGDTKVTTSGGAILVGGSATCEGNDVNGDVVVDNNVAFIAIAGNTIQGNLTCTGNDPAPELGTNTVRGTKADQCA